MLRLALCAAPGDALVGVLLGERRIELALDAADLHPPARAGVVTLLEVRASA